MISTNTIDTGLEVIDLHSDTAFAGRHLHVLNIASQMKGMERLARAFVESPDTLLQELANAAVELCGADSSGITLETADKNEAEFYRWVATAGEYAHFINATLPRHPSACGICLERKRPQIFRVSQKFFDLMHIEAPIVTDGILLPWSIGETRGTIWIMAHNRTEAFDSDDCRMMQTLADFTAMAMRHQFQQRALMRQATIAAASAMANEIAHHINNPLQALTNVVYLAAEGRSGSDAKALGQQLTGDLQRLSVLVRELLSLPGAASA